MKPGRLLLLVVLGAALSGCQTDRQNPSSQQSPPSMWSRLFAVLQAQPAQQPIVQRPPVRLGGNPTPAEYAALMTEGSAVYSRECAVCHGAYGDGKGPIAVNQPVPPRSFLDHSWMGTHADGDFFVSVKRGVPGTAMPPFAGRLSERQIWAAVAYVRGFSPDKVVFDVNAAATDRAPNANLGQTLFQENCAGCHGPQGLGNGQTARVFQRPPRNLTNRNWMASRSDDQLKKIVNYGVPGSPMPGFSDTLNDSQLDDLVAYLRVISHTVSRQSEPTALYQRHCAQCHGLQGDGRGPHAAQLDPAPRNFRNVWWQAGQTDQMLSDAVRRGRPGSMMPPFGALLSEAEIKALVAQVRAFSTMVPGAQASLTTDPAGLRAPDAAPNVPTGGN